MQGLCDKGRCSCLGALPQILQKRLYASANLSGRFQKTLIG